MVNDNASEPDLVSNRFAICLQRILAIPFILVTLCFAIAGLGMLSHILQGNLKEFVPFVGLVAVGSVTGFLAQTLMLGRGLPLWFMRAIWLCMAIGLISVLIVTLVNGAQGNANGVLLAVGWGSWALYSTFKAFWYRVSR